MVFCKTNEKRSISSKVHFMKLMLTENFFVQDTLILQSCTKEKATLMHFLLMPTLKPLFHFCITFMKKSTVIQFSWRTFKHMWPPC